MAKSLFTKILFSAVLLSFFFFPGTILAQSANTANTSGDSKLFLQKQDAIKNNTGLESWTNEAMGSNMMSLFIGLNGTIPAQIFETGTSQTSFYYMPGGAVGKLNQMIAVLHTPPASGIEYIAQMKDSFLGKPAYAQGVGFQGLQFLLPLWRGFRNMVYVLATLVFLVMGLMIILRVKISPQAVITIQSAIPQLLTTLILVTFSYAIAGLVIDLANLIQAFVVALLFSVQGVPLNQNLIDIGQSGGLPLLSDLGDAIAAMFRDIFSIKPLDYQHLTAINFDTFKTLAFQATPGWASMVILGGLVGGIVTGFLAGGLGNAVFGESGRFLLDKAGSVLGGAGGGLIGGTIVPLILSILVAFWLIRLFFGLLKSYVTLIFKVVLGPLEIGMGAFPNSKMGFSSWFMDVVANMAVFPIVSIYLILLNLIVNAVSLSGAPQVPIPTVWAPSLISGGSISASVLGAAVGLAGLALLARLPDMVPEFIFMIKPSPYGKAIGEGLGQITSVGRSAGRAGLQYASQIQEARYDAKVAAGTNTRTDNIINAVGEVGGLTGTVKRKSS